MLIELHPTHSQCNAVSRTPIKRDGLLFFIESMNYTKLQAGKAKQTLSKTVQYKSRYLTLDAFIRLLVDEGRTPCKQEVDKIKPLNSRAHSRANNEKQEDHERKIREAGKKWIYSLDKDELSMAIGAFEYAYAMYLVALQQGTTSD